MLTVLWAPAEAAELVGHVEEDHISEKCRVWGGQSRRVYPSSSWTLNCSEHGSGHGASGSISCHPL